MTEPKLKTPRVRLLRRAWCNALNLTLRKLDKYDPCGVELELKKKFLKESVHGWDAVEEDRKYRYIGAVRTMYFAMAQCALGKAAYDDVSQAVQFVLDHEPFGEGEHEGFSSVVNAIERQVAEAALSEFVRLGGEL